MCGMLHDRAPHKRGPDGRQYSHHEILCAQNQRWGLAYEALVVATVHKNFLSIIDGGR